MAGNATKSFRRMNVRLVQLYRLRQMLHAERPMANRAAFFLRLSVGDAGCER